MRLLLKYQNFNPIIGLILTASVLDILYFSSLFQSHYRSDFNMNMIMTSASMKYFNPIIGLILTLVFEMRLKLLVNFNPIIGLILTTDRKEYSFLNSEFQSHYRSDFNSAGTHSFQVIFDFNPIIGLILTYQKLNIKCFK